MATDLETYAKWLGGEASPEEQREVETALRDRSHALPKSLRRVRGIVERVTAAPAVPLVEEPERKGLRIPRRLPPLTVLALAASILIGVGIAALVAWRFLPQAAPSTGPQLVALQLRPEAFRGSPAGAPPPTVEASLGVEPNGDYLTRMPFRLTIQGTRVGEVTVVRVGHAVSEVYGPIAATDPSVTDRGIKFSPPRGPEVIFVCVTPRPPGETIRRVVEEAGEFSADELAFEKQVGQLQEEIRRKLRNDGQPWVAVSSVRVKGS